MMEKDNLLTGKRILVVDDEPDILESLEELLSMCEVTSASSFGEAEKLLEKGGFDLAVLDIMGVDGYRLLALARKKNVIAVMLTANALSPAHTVKSYKEGAALYIPKEELANIAVFLNDVLEAKKKGKSTWWRWIEKFDPYYTKKFGPNWKDENEEVWKNLISY